jgi:1,4-alpha-glucan branching enzyme
VAVIVGYSVIHDHPTESQALRDTARVQRVAADSAALPRVQFVLVARDARKVAVVGDFNGWDASHAEYQAKHRGGGVWSVTAPVPAGHHRYSFVVDDSVWMADPAAPRAIDKDYGLPNSAIVVGAHEQ